MREILFRGKCQTGEWVEGCYVNHLTRMLCPIGDFLKEGDEKHYIVNSGFADWNMPRNLEFVEVIPETVGQYTGLKDKHGKKIFEGDIVKSITHFYGESKEMVTVIKFNEVENDSFGEPFTVGYSLLGSEWELIGNIHDNPELFT